MSIRRRKRRVRYREPVFSGGFTALLLVLILAGCAVVLFIVMGDGLRGRNAATIEPMGYYNGGESTPDTDVHEGNVYSGETQDNEADETPSYSDTPGNDYEPGYADDVTNGYVYPYTPTDEVPYAPTGEDDTIALLTQVDNTLLPWNLKLVNRYNFLDYTFYPQLTYLGVGGGHRFDSRAYRALLDMLASARSEGLDPVIVSSFRSVSRQTYLFDRQVQRHINNGYSAEDAFEAARRVVAYPGTSEHNLGLAVDIVSNSYHGLTARQADTAEGRWLAENSYRYGFVMRYPYYQQHITNIIFEPWHFRYVGVEAATEMFNRGLVLEEFVSELLAR